MANVMEPSQAGCRTASRAGSGKISRAGSRTASRRSSGTASRAGSGTLCRTVRKEQLWLTVATICLLLSTNMATPDTSKFRPSDKA